jgi:hypothetical protein
VGWLRVSATSDQGPESAETSAGSPEPEPEPEAESAGAGAVVAAGSAPTNVLRPGPLASLIERSRPSSARTHPVTSICGAAVPRLTRNVFPAGSRRPVAAGLGTVIAAATMSAEEVPTTFDQRWTRPSADGSRPRTWTTSACCELDRIEAACRRAGATRVPGTMPW